jgi:hypothetical protein
MKYYLRWTQFYRLKKTTTNETVLVDPKTKIKTTVPKDPSKPGAIAKDERGNLTLDTKTKGTVDRGIKPGDNVVVKAIK